MKLGGTVHPCWERFCGWTSAIGLVLCGSHSWAQSTGANVIAQPLRPMVGARVQQNPPDFAWPWVALGQRYEVILTGPGYRRTILSNSNLLSWPEALPFGEFKWTVRSIGGREIAGGGFVVPPDATVFVVPEARELLERVVAQAHPRFSPTGLAGSTDPMVRKLLATVSRFEGERVPEPSDPEGVTGARDRSTLARAARDLHRSGDEVADRLIDTVAATMLSKDDRWRKELRRRLLIAAGWRPDGPTGVKGVHSVASDLAFAMALAYDQTYTSLSTDDRRLVVRAIMQRLEDIEAEFMQGERLFRRSRDSHGWGAWGLLSATVALIAGDDLRADAMFLRTVPGFITSISPWGGEDGGFANGVAYASFRMGAQALPMDVLGQVIGVNLFAKPAMANFARFMAYFLPPGAPMGPFGDGVETRVPGFDRYAVENWARRTNMPLAWWHAGALGGEPSRLGPLLLAPPLPSTVKPKVPDSWLQSDVGWAAMHGSLADPSRVSVYFKSSPFGSFNHAHADQNAFVVHAGGEALAVGSGYYDSYGSAHWRDWYQSTRAHNAITFDGGAGQRQQDPSAIGRIVFWASSSVGDVVVGDAREAYGGALDRATRTLVFVRPNLVLVRDQLAARSPRTWEWRVHAIDKMMLGENSIRIDRRGESLCIDLLQAPEVEVGQTTGFGTEMRAKRSRQDMADQWHAAWATKERQGAAEFLVSMRVGCQGSAPKAMRQRDGGWRIAVHVDGKNREIVFGLDAAEIQ